MKILTAKFILEANANVGMLCDLEHVDIRFGSACLERMQLTDAFDKKNVELIPAIYADASSSGIMKKACFDYIEQRILQTLKAHLWELDGIFIHLHGASEVEEIGSGDHHILQEIRKITGPYMPIAVVCDPHGNLCRKYVEQTTILRSYRESPHTDIEETIRFVCGQLLDVLENRQCIHSVYRKLPLILGGEQSVSQDEPVCTINRYMDELEQDIRIRSCSWHVGYIRHDCDAAGCGIVVVPAGGEDQEYAEAIAEQLAAFVWDKRHVFHYTGLSASPEKALQQALAFEGSPVFITDSGDNVTSGSTGANTYILRQVLALPALQKRFLFAAIFDDTAYGQLSKYQAGQECIITIGKAYDELSEPVTLTVIIKHIGRMCGTAMFGEHGDFGGCVSVSVKDRPIDIIIADTNHPFVERHQTMAADMDWMEYDVIVVKTGYAFPEVKRDGQMCIMSLTEGPTLQDTSALPFKRIMRPMYPIDNI